MCLCDRGHLDCVDSNCGAPVTNGHVEPGWRDPGWGHKTGPHATGREGWGTDYNYDFYSDDFAHDEAAPPGEGERVVTTTPKAGVATTTAGQTVTTAGSKNEEPTTTERNDLPKTNENKEAQTEKGRATATINPIQLKSPELDLSTSTTIATTTIARTSSATTSTTTITTASTTTTTTTTTTTKEDSAAFSVSQANSLPTDVTEQINAKSPTEAKVPGMTKTKLTDVPSTTEHDGTTVESRQATSHSLETTSNSLDFETKTSAESSATPTPKVEAETDRAPSERPKDGKKAAELPAETIVHDQKTNQDAKDAEAQKLDKQANENTPSDDSNGVADDLDSDSEVALDFGDDACDPSLRDGTFRGCNLCVCDDDGKEKCTQQKCKSNHGGTLPIFPAVQYLCGNSVYSFTFNYLCRQCTYTVSFISVSSCQSEDGTAKNHLDVSRSDGTCSVCGCFDGQIVCLDKDGCKHKACYSKHGDLPTNYT